MATAWRTAVQLLAEIAETEFRSPDGLTAGEAFARINEMRAINTEASAAIKNDVDASLYREDMARLDTLQEQLLAQIERHLMEALQDGRVIGFGYSSPDSERRQIDPKHWHFLELDARRNRAESKKHGLVYAGLRFARESDLSRARKHRPTAQEPAESNVYSIRPGTPGRPTSRHIVELEFRRRAASGEVEPRLGLEAEALRKWLRHQHPKAPPLTKKAIENFLRSEFNQLKIKSGPQNPNEKAPK